jgi:hypothetical protein
MNQDYKKHLLDMAHPRELYKVHKDPRHFPFASTVKDNSGKNSIFFKAVLPIACGLPELPPERLDLMHRVLSLNHTWDAHRDTTILYAF